MTETQAAVAAADVNPFDDGAFSHGGGLWDGKTVTITAAVVKTEALTYGDGKPVTNDKGEQSIQTALNLSGIAEGGDDKERRETYSGGDKLAATPDGEGFTTKDGSPLKFHANSNIAKFSAALKASGYDIGNLLVKDANGAIVYLAPGIPKQRFSALVGARFVFRGEPKKGKDGKVIKDKKGYDKMAFYPDKFVGYVPGAGAAKVAVSGGNGGNGLDAKATAKVAEILAAGPATKAQLVAKLAQGLAGDSDANGIIGLVVNDKFHDGKPWKYDRVNSTASL